MTHYVGLWPEAEKPKKRRGLSAAQLRVLQALAAGGHLVIETDGSAVLVNGAGHTGGFGYVAEELERKNYIARLRPAASGPWLARITVEGKAALAANHERKAP